VLALCVGMGAVAQQDPTGAYVLDNGEQLLSNPDSSGHVTATGQSDPFFSDIFFGFDVARDIELVQNESGFVTGYYMLDGWGGQHEVGDVTAYNLEQKPYFGWDIAKDMEVVNVFKLITDSVTGDVVGSQVMEQVGYYILDGFGGIFPVNNTVDLPFRRGSSDPLFKVYNDFPSSNPEPYNYPYFGWDIARDMEVSYIFQAVTDAEGTMIVGKSNGYYIMDGFGAIHNARTDMDGNPIYAPWHDVSRPYFDWDIARDFELTPRGDGYYLLDGLGAVFTVNASLTFGENAQHPNIPPYFGFDIAKDLELVQGVNGSVVGYYVLDGQGVIYPLGNAPDVGQVVDLPSAEEIFRDLEISPLYTPITFPSTAFKPGVDVGGGAVDNPDKEEPNVEQPDQEAPDRAEF
jgi:hypothetical protein